MYDYNNKSNDNQGFSQRIRSNMESDLALPCYLSSQRFIRYPLAKLHLTTAPNPKLVFHLLVLLSKKSFNPVRSPSLLPFPRCPPSSPTWPPLLQQVNLFVGLQVCSWQFLSVRVYLLSNNIFLGLGGHTALPEGSQFPHQESNPCPLQCNCRVLTTGLPGKSLLYFLLHSFHLLITLEFASFFSFFFLVCFSQLEYKLCKTRDLCLFCSDIAQVSRTMCDIQQLLNKIFGLWVREFSDLEKLLHLVSPSIPIGIMNKESSLSLGERFSTRAIHAFLHTQNIYQ